MPRKAMDYSKTIIYKIQHEDNEELVYVGHTTNFIKRKNGHKSRCNNEKGKIQFKTIYYD
jgi:predicted GIY-YIG superfamily endonuclease